MPRKRAKKEAPKYPEGWEVSEHLRWNNRHITPGIELSITGVRGRYRFVKHVRFNDKEWIDVVGGKQNLSRSFHPSRIKTVHRISKTRANVA